MADRPRLIVAGPGHQHYREHAMATLAEDFEVVLVDRDYPTWQGRYAATHRVARTTDAARLFYSVADLRGEVPEAAVLTWDGPSVVAVAEVAAKLGMRSISAAAVRICGDRTVLCEALAAAGLRTVRHDHAGVAVEQHGQNLALTAHCVVLDGRAEVVAVSRAWSPDDDPQAPTGWVVGPWQKEPWADELRHTAAAAHTAVGADWGVTQFDVSIVSEGLGITGLRPWPADDLIPVLVETATGVDLIAAAAAIAFERDPDIEPRRSRHAAICFLSSTERGRLETLTLPAVSTESGLFAAHALAAVGDEIEPQGAAVRLAALLVVGDDEPAVRDSLAAAAAISLIEFS